STSEMSAKGKSGMRIDLDKVPTRQANMKAWEILLSESQERMLIVGKKGQEAQLYAVFDKWDLECAQIGEVTNTGRLEYYHHGEKVADVPAEALVLGGGAPVYKRDFKKPAYIDKVARFRANSINAPEDYLATAKKIFTSPNIVSKRWIYEQYDSMVRTNTMTTNAPSDAALVRVKGTNKALAITTDCNPIYTHADPYIGAMIAVAEAARNIVCSGGEPVAITNCLNFGNPYNPEVYWQFVQAIKGMGDACRKFDTPVTGGNVSFYNQSVLKDRTEPVYPTPTIGMLGILDDASRHTTLDFKKAGHQIYMIGTPHNDIACSEYLRVIHGVELSPPPHFDLDEEFHIQHNLKIMIREGMIQSAHDISEGGLFVTLLESAMVNGLGFDVETDTNFRKDAYLFGESQSRVVVTVALDVEDDLVNYLNTHNVPFTKLGEVSGTNVVIDKTDFGPITTWKTLYDNTLAEKMS
ncbi:MAG TPA: AIR synthase-related protein, partial [Saprospiraceae bacterium]|nr:AIR synthase-related protein [Saprospiraceae bacterium]